MSLSNYPRAAAQLVAIGVVLEWLIADTYFGVKVSRWPPAARYAPFGAAVGALT